MHPRTLPFRRIASLRPLRPPNYPRLFTQNTLSSRPRPQLPFLFAPSRRPNASRYITTETRLWIKTEVWRGLRWSAYIWTTLGLCGVMVFGVQQEWLERNHPTPPDWSYVSRQRLRFYNHVLAHKDDPEYIPDWVMLAFENQVLLDRLHDPSLDGAELEEQLDGGILIDGVGKTGYDISKKNEPWRRGYYNTLMNVAQAAEHVDDWILDEKRNVAFPKALMVGPSNPNPKPIPLGSLSAPKEEDCNDRLFPPPEVFYTRILTTKGFSQKQRVDCAIAYATWLDFKKAPGAAKEMYEWALDIATDNSPTPLFNRATGVLNAGAGLPSENLLAAVTGLATHYAAQGDINTALPMFISILRARKALPEPERAPVTPEAEAGASRIWSFVKMLFTPPAYPPAPGDGTQPLVHTDEERCKDAGIMTNVGEILFASKSGATNKDEGLAWTREAVDIAEEEVSKFSIRDGDKIAGFIPVLENQTKKTCKKCMEVGLSNWAKMVSTLAKEERQAKKAAPPKTGGWLGFGGVEAPEASGRWESELLVVKERLRRASRLLKIREEDILDV